MENRLENKAKFFGLYILQKVLKDSDCSENVQASVLVTPNNVFSSQYLELKPLHIISDEQAIELCRTVSPLSFENENYKWKVVRDEEIGFLTISCRRSFHSFSFSFINGRVFMYDGDELSNNYLDHYKAYLFLVNSGFYVGDGAEIEYGWVRLKGDPKP